MPRIFIYMIAFAITLNTKLSIASQYWDIKIPPMENAENVISSKDNQTGIHTLSFNIVLEKHTDPIKFYNSFFSRNNWVHFMKETYEKFPEQFENEPTVEWSSFAAITEDEKFIIKFGSLWQNKFNNTNANLSMAVDKLKDEFFNARIEIKIGPEIDLSSLIEFANLTKNNPKSLLRLADLAGGDPFSLDEVDFDKIKSYKTDDSLILKYIEAIDLIYKQYSEFVAMHVTEN